MSFLLSVLSLLCAPLHAGAVSHVLLVGSNAPGPGQAVLQYAVDDAARMQAVLEELGGIAPDHMQTLADPDVRAMELALDHLGRELAEERAQGLQTMVTFYYSGHARARGLVLGDEELPLTELRARLEALEANLTLVILDACQAGALSQAKGLEPAADFSWNSVQGLQMEGLVVLSSSTASELSQESEELGGSYFTHHLVSGLRGAADQDHDGSVTLGEAYPYAYHHTLVATAATRVGAQHAVLEANLEGRGEMVLTRPRAASSMLYLPAEAEGDLLVHRAEDSRVVAEVHKAWDDTVTLGLVPGAYVVLWRLGDTLDRCEITLAEGHQQTLDQGDCEPVVLEQAEAKGGWWGWRRLETVMAELSLGGLATREDGYDGTLRDFGFDGDYEDLLGAQRIYELNLVGSINRNLALVATVGGLSQGSWSRTLEGVDEADYEHQFSWTSTRYGLSARAGWPLWRGRLVPYVQGGGGATHALTTYRDNERAYDEAFWGWHVAAAAGLQLMPREDGWRHLGLFGQVQTLWAPTLENLLGDVHDCGGNGYTFGLRAGF